MLTGFVLVVIAVLCRLASAAFHWWNFVPMGAIALYAGARLPRRWAWLAPVTAMVFADLIIDYRAGRSLFELWRWVGYATFGALSLLGPLARGRNVGIWRYPGLSLAASTFFFLTSNFAVWAEGRMYPMTSAGLFTCYFMGLEFYGRTIAADLVGTGVFFGLGPVIERAVKRLTLSHSGEPIDEIELSRSAHGG
jgi:hypothetical protein